MSISLQNQIEQYNFYPSTDKEVCKTQKSEGGKKRGYFRLIPSKEIHNKKQSKIQF